MEFREISSDEFDSFVNSFEMSSMYQSSEYSNIMKNQEYSIEFVGLFDDSNNIIAASLILIEKLGQFKYAYAPRGFLIDYTDLDLLKEFTTNVKEYLRKKGIMAIKICPLILKSKYSTKEKISISNPNYDKCFENLKSLKYYHLGYNNFFESFKPRFEAISKLNKNTIEMFDSLSDDIKEKIKNSDLAGIRIYKGEKHNLEYVYENMRKKNEKGLDYIKDLYDAFSKNDKIEIYFAQLETKVYLVNTQLEYQKQVNLCSKITDDLFKNQGQTNNDLINEKIKEDNKLADLKEQLVYATGLLREYPNGIILSCVMAIKHRGKVYLTLDGSNDKFEHLCAKYLLTWKVMEKFAKEGYSELCIGGITNPNFEGEDKFKESTNFRLSFNSDAVEYCGDFELVTHFPFYTLYRNISPFRKMVKKQDE